MSRLVEHESKWVGLREIEEPRSLFPFTHGGLIASLGVVFALDTYGWVENCSYTTNFLDQILLKDKCLIIVYEYAKFMLFFVMKSMYFA
jgi:hypothetical protein